MSWKIKEVLSVIRPVLLLLDAKDRHNLDNIFVENEKRASFNISRIGGYVDSYYHFHKTCLEPVPQSDKEMYMRVTKWYYGGESFGPMRKYIDRFEKSFLKVRFLGNWQDEIFKPENAARYIVENYRG